MKQVQCFGPTFLDLHVNIAAFWRIWLGAYKNDTLCKGGGGHDKWVPVDTVWRIVRLWMEEPPPVWRVAANIFKKKSRTVKKLWSSSMGVGPGANNSSS